MLWKQDWVGFHLVSEGIGGVQVNKGEGRLCQNRVVMSHPNPLVSPAKLLGISQKALGVRVGS